MPSNRATGFELNTLITDMTSEEYHSTPETYSSSQLKDALEDVSKFHKKYIEKSMVKEESDAFSTGTYFHTGVLEPHLLEKECAVYDGTIRRGAVWEKFAESNKGKCILTKPQHRQAESLIVAVKKSPVAMGFIARGEPEISTFVRMTVDEFGNIWAEGRTTNFKLAPEGWVRVKTKIPAGVKFVIKTRADCLGAKVGDEFVLDLKSTSGNAKNHREMKNKISSFNYDLSAALYLDVFSVTLERAIIRFIWVFGSKDFLNTQSYVASEKNILVGRAKWTKALRKIAKGIASEWSFDDVLETLEPNVYELDYLEPNDLDAL